MNAESFFEEFEDFFRRNLRLVGLCLVLVAAGAAFWFTLSYFKTQRAENALEQVQQYLDVSQWPVVSADESAAPGKVPGKEFSSQTDKDSRVSTMVSDLLTVDASSGVHTFALLQKAKEIVKESGIDSALSFLQSSRGSVGVGLQSSIFSLNVALLKLKSSNSTTVGEAISELEALAYKDKYVSDVAYYQLGEFAWQQGKTAEAKNYWNSLIADHYQNGSKGGVGVSPWAKKAAQRKETLL